MPIRFSYLTCLFLYSVVPLAHAQSAENILPEGAFDVKINSFFAGWRSGGFLGGVPGENRMWNNSVTAEADPTGVGIVRLAIKDTGGASIGISQTEPVVLNPEWTTLTLRATVRVSDFVKLADWGGACQFTIVFRDLNDKPIQGDFKFDTRKNTADWEEMTADFKIPDLAASMSVDIQFLGATGVIEIKNLRVLGSGTR